MSEIEAAGDAVTGGLAARALEPKAGETADGHTHETHCLNCGARLAGDYCHACGQQAHVHRTLGAFFHDLLHGVLHFEGKIWRTLPMLAWKPGELTRRYVDGQRARFISPIALFLFSVFLTFAVMGLTGALDRNFGGPANAELASEIAKAEARVEQIEGQREAARARRQPTGELDSKLSEARAELAALRAFGGGKAAPEQRAEMSEEAPDWLRGTIDRASENPELLFYKLKTNTYKFGWALIPISVPFVWLLFPFSRRFGLYDHTVFVTYSLAFMMLLLVAGTLLAFVSPTIASLAWFIPPVHMYRQLRGAYCLGALSALWRTALLIIFACFAIGLFAALLVGIGALD